MFLSTNILPATAILTRATRDASLTGLERKWRWVAHGGRSLVKDHAWNSQVRELIHHPNFHVKNNETMDTQKNYAINDL